MGVIALEAEDEERSAPNALPSGEAGKNTPTPGPAPIEGAGNALG
jgi:hypothetical protein